MAISENTDYTDLYEFVTNTGVIVPKTSDVKTGIQEKFRDIFGADLDVSDETPVGRLIEAITMLVKTTLGVTAQNANQFNVNTATGIYLDSLAQVYGISREVGTYTQAKITVTGSASGFTVPAGALIQNKDTYDIFKVVDAITVPANQLVGTGYAVATETGALAADAGQLTTIKTGTLGWLSVTNAAAHSIGRLVETDEEFRARIIASRPVGQSFMTSVYSRVSRVEGVTSCVIYENNNAGDVYKNGVVIPGHSLFVCVAGGANNDIASALVGSKPPGTGFASYTISGETGDIPPVEVSYSSDGYAASIYFYRPEQRSVYVSVMVETSLYTGTNIDGDVKSAITSYFLTTGIGETIYVSSISMAITRAIPTISVVSIQVGFSQTPLGASIALTGYQVGRTNNDTITVTSS